MEQITERQFNALARVAGIGVGTKTHAAMKLVFVGGESDSAAARLTGVTRNVVTAAKNKMLGVIPTIPGRISLLQEALGK